MLFVFRRYACNITYTRVPIKQATVLNRAPIRFTAYLRIVRHSIVFEDEETGEGRVHVSVEIGRASQQHQPHLVGRLELQYGDVGRRRPIRNTLGPNGRHHGTVLDDVHRRLHAWATKAHTLESRNTQLCASSSCSSLSYKLWSNCRGSGELGVWFNLFEST